MTEQNPSPTAADPASIRAIVEEVVRRILADGAGRPSSVPAVRPSTVPAGRPSSIPAGTTASGSIVASGVISLDLVERLPAGTTRVSIAEKAVVTPSARDRAKERGIAIVRTATATSQASHRPLVIGFADAGPEAAARAAEIARAVPGASLLPASGLADLLAAIATHASRDAARAILLTGRRDAAVVLANRSASLRAVTGRDAAALLAAASECGANLLVVGTRDLAPTALGRLAAEFAGREMTIPNELAAAPAGCGCKTHPH